MYESNKYMFTFNKYLVSTIQKYLLKFRIIIYITESPNDFNLDICYEDHDPK